MNLRNLLFSVFAISFIIVSFESSGQNRRADGYKGIWATSAKSPVYGYRYSGGMGTSSPYHKPVAIYSAKAKKTFFVYGGTTKPDEINLQIMVSYYDHRKGVFPKPVIVYDKAGVNDPQDNPSISIDSEGFIYVFVSGMARTRPGFIFKSSKPYDIDKFEKIYEGEIVFPQPWWIKDSCFVMMYTKFLNGRELFCSTSSNGKNWTRGVRIASMGGHNQVTAINDNKIYTCFNYFPGRSNEKQTNVYLLQSDDLGKTWKTIDDTIIKTPLREIRNNALLKDFESEKKIVFIKDLSFDSSGNPVILVLTSMDHRPGPTGDPREWIVIHRKDSKWIFSKVCQSFHNHDMGSLYIGEEEWRIVGSTDQGPQKYGTGGEMALWVSIDEGNTWKRAVDITSGSLKNNSFPRRPINVNRKFYSFWVDGDPNAISESRLYFTDESCKKVWVLPYNMSLDFERPVRVK